MAVPKHVTPAHCDTSVVVFQFESAFFQNGPFVSKYKELRACRLVGVSHWDGVGDIVDEATAKTAEILRTRAESSVVPHMVLSIPVFIDEEMRIDIVRGAQETHQEKQKTSAYSHYVLKLVAYITAPLWEKKEEMRC